MATPSALQSITIGTGGGKVSVAVTTWTGNWQYRLAETSTGATTGTRYAGVRPDPQWTATFPLDDPNFPEVMGWDPGSVIGQVAFLHSSKCDIVTNTTVESVQKSIDTNNDVPRIVVTGKGGDIAYNQAQP